MKKRPSVSRKHIIYVTHLFVIEAPEMGLRKIPFLTGKMENIKMNEFFYGFHVIHCYDSIELFIGLSLGKIVKLPEPKPIEEDQNLWIDKYYNIYLTNFSDPNMDTAKEKLCNLLQITEKIPPK